MINLIARAPGHGQRTAIISEGQTYTYVTLLAEARQVAATLLAGRPDLQQRRVCFLISPGFAYVAVQWGIWLAGGVGVPLSDKYPVEAMQYVIDDSQAEILVYGPSFAQVVSSIACPRYVNVAERSQAASTLPDIKPTRRAMILYTSGTTGAPKGVVTTHRIIESQITTLVDAWRWRSDDHILNVLPMHHVHGIINILSCALWSGACCEFLPKFEPERVWQTFGRSKVNVFMAVPTIYYQLIATYRKLPASHQAELTDKLQKFRLMVSGSAALPISVLEEWRSISGHTLLERYGMTEIGMAISNPYDGERKPGSIGSPLPGVSIRLVDEHDHLCEEGTPGEIQIKGNGVFEAYWNRPKATAAQFTEEGWFRSGDIAVRQDGYYRILGRNSVDIIKSGGYKISALEIEEILRQHEEIMDCGVVGIPDEEWGEIIAVALIVQNVAPDERSLTQWLKERLPSYKVPRRFLVLDDLPRNAMGKVTKKQLVRIFQGEL